MVDSSGQIGRFLPAMVLNAPYLPPNPHRPRAFGGKGAEGMKKEILSNNPRKRSRRWRRPTDPPSASLCNFRGS